MYPNRFVEVTYLGLVLIGRPETHNHTSVSRGRILMASASPGKGFRQSAHMLRPQTARTGALKGIKTTKSSASADMRLYREVSALVEPPRLPRGDLLVGLPTSGLLVRLVEG